MKKIILVLLGCFCLTGCFKRDSMEDINIYTTIYPLQFITQALYGDYSNIESIYPNGVNVQLEKCTECDLSYTLTEKQISDISKTDLFIFNSLLYEGDYVKEMLQNNKNLKIINANDNLVESEYYGLEEMWLDPSRLLTLARNIKNGFNEYIDNYYLKQEVENNFKELKEKADKLSAKIVTNDDMFKFLEKDKYGLKVYSLEENENLNQKTISDVKSLINDGTIKYIYIRQYDEPNETINNLIKGTDVEIIKLHMITNLTENEISNKQDYFTLMEQNIELLKKSMYN